MAKHELTIVAVEVDPILTIEQLCLSCQVTPEFIHELVIHGIIEPKDPIAKHFDLRQLQRVRILLRLQHDLAVNLEGAALVLDLLDQLDEMRKKMVLLNKYL